MKNIKCVIRKNLVRKDNLNLIYVRYTYNRRFVLFNANITVSVKNWNDRTGRVRKSDNFEEKNLLLAQRERELEIVYIKLLSNNIEPTLLNIKKEFFIAVNQNTIKDIKPKKIDEKEFLKDFQEFIDYRKAMEKVSIGTIKTYKTTKVKLEDFQNDTNYALHYDTINNIFYDQFLKFLRKQKLVDNSTDKHIKNLKLFMYYTLEKEKHNNNIFQTFKRTKNKADFVVLDREELQKLYYECPLYTETERKVRDAFIFGCCTGLRFGDLSKLTSGNFHIKRDKETNEILQEASQSFIHVGTQKTTSIVTIPLNHLLCELIEKYDLENKKPDFLYINHQFFNREIKKICRNAGITSKVKLSKKTNNQFIEKEMDKCDFIASHTMRRTFITLLSNLTEIANIQAISGHKDIKILTDYIRKNDNQLNSVRSCFDEVFYKSNKANTTSTPDKSKVKTTIIKTRLITQ